MTAKIFGKTETDSGKIPASAIRVDLKNILASAVGRDYAYFLACDECFLEAVKKNVEETSGWEDEHSYTDDDVRLAIGRVIMDRFGIEY